MYIHTSFRKFCAQKEPNLGLFSRSAQLIWPGFIVLYLGLFSKPGLAVIYVAHIGLLSSISDFFQNR